MVKDSMRASFILGQWRAYHIPLVYGNALSVFQPRVLANGIFIDWCDVMILAYIKAIICVIFTMYSDTCLLYTSPSPRD